MYITLHVYKPWHVYKTWPIIQKISLHYEQLTFRREVACAIKIGLSYKKWSVLQRVACETQTHKVACATQSGLCKNWPLPASASKIGLLKSVCILLKFVCVSKNLYTKMCLFYKSGLYNENVWTMKVDLSYIKWSML